MSLHTGIVDFVKSLIINKFLVSYRIQGLVIQQFFLSRRPMLNIKTVCQDTNDSLKRNPCRPIEPTQQT